MKIFLRIMLLLVLVVYCYAVQKNYKEVVTNGPTFASAHHPDQPLKIK